MGESVQFWSCSFFFNRFGSSFNLCSPFSMSHLRSSSSHQLSNDSKKAPFNGGWAAVLATCHLELSRAICAFACVGQSNQDKLQMIYINLA